MQVTRQRNEDGGYTLTLPDGAVLATVTHPQRHLWLAVQADTRISNRYLSFVIANVVEQYEAEEQFGDHRYRRTASGIYRVYDAQRAEVCTVTYIDEEFRRDDGAWFAYSGVCDAYGTTREEAVAKCVQAVKEYAEHLEVKAEFDKLSDKVEEGMRRLPKGSLSTTAWQCLQSGSENADDTGLELGSTEHMRLTISGFWSLMDEQRPEWGDPYTRNLEDDRWDEAGAFTPFIGERESEFIAEKPNGTVRTWYRSINGKRFKFGYRHDTTTGVLHLVSVLTDTAVARYFSAHVATPQHLYSATTGRCACQATIALSINQVWLHGSTRSVLCDINK